MQADLLHANTNSYILNCRGYNISKKIQGSNSELGLTVIQQRERKPEENQTMSSSSSDKINRQVFENTIFAETKHLYIIHFFTEVTNSKFVIVFAKSFQSSLQKMTIRTGRCFQVGLVI